MFRRIPTLESDLRDLVVVEIPDLEKVSVPVVEVVEIVRHLDKHGTERHVGTETASRPKLIKFFILRSKRLTKKVNSIGAVL